MPMMALSWYPIFRSSPILAIKIVSGKYKTTIASIRYSISKFFEQLIYKEKCQVQWITSESILHAPPPSASYHHSFPPRYVVVPALAVTPYLVHPLQF